MAGARQRPGAVAALGNGAMEEPFGSGTDHQQAHRHAAGGDAEDRHVAGVAAKLADVGPHPLQGQHHVQQAVVRFAGFQRPVAEEAERTEAIVERDGDDAPSGEGFARDPARAGAKSAAVDPDHHRPLAVINARRPDVQGQAVFAGAGKPPLTSLRLRTGRAVCRRGPNALVDRCGLRRPPAQIRQRGTGVGHPQKRPAPIRLRATKLALLGADHRCRSSPREERYNPGKEKSAHYLLQIGDYGRFKRGMLLEQWRTTRRAAETIDPAVLRPAGLCRVPGGHSRVPLPAFRVLPGLGAGAHRHRLDPDAGPAQRRGHRPLDRLPQRPHPNPLRQAQALARRRHGGDDVLRLAAVRPERRGGQLAPADLVGAAVAGLDHDQHPLLRLGR